MLLSMEIAVGDWLEAPMFGTDVVRARVDRVYTDRNGTVRIRARLEDDPHGMMLLTVDEDRVFAMVEEPLTQRRWKIQPQPDYHFHTVAEVESTDIDKLQCATCGGHHGSGAAHSPVDGWADSLALAPPTTQSGGAEIDVMIVYTPAARDWANSWAGGINSAIAQAMERAQLVADNSGVDLTFNLVHSALVHYQESGNANLDLNHLVNPNSGSLDIVHSWRDEFGADLVAMFTLEHQFGGIAELLNWRPGAPDKGFSITRIQQAHNTYTHIHEMGHNLGLHHRKDQAIQPGPTEWWANSWPGNTWSAGWRWGSGNERFCSVMSYNESWDGHSVWTVPYFSSPLTTFQGQPTGHAQDGDNVRTLRETKHTVAGYRESVSRTIRITGDMEYGEIEVGQSTQRTMILHNDGTEPLQVTGQEWPTGFSGGWTGTLASGQSQPITVEFNPVAAEFHAGAAEVVSDATGGNRWHTLSGYGASLASYSLDIVTPTPGAAVSSSTETMDVSGTAGVELVGQFRWTNLLTGAAGLIPASSAWTVSAVPLQVGTNWIHVHGSNQPASIVRASDSAVQSAYSSGWVNGQNGGFGFDPWELTVFGSNGGFFRQASAIGSQSWGLWANSGQSGLDDSTAVAVRSLSQFLVPSNTFLVAFQNKWIQDSRSVGIALQNEDGEYLFEFMFIGGRDFYTINDRVAGRQTSIGWTDQGLELAFDLTGPDTYQLRVGAHSITGELAQRNDMRIHQFRAWNFSAGPGPNYDFFINDLSVTNSPVAAISAMGETFVVRQEPELELEWSAQSDLVVSWPLMSTGALDLYRSTNLLLPNSGFLPYLTNLPAGYTSHTVTVHEAEGPAFYRLQITP